MSIGQNGVPVWKKAVFPAFIPALCVLSDEPEGHKFGDSQVLNEVMQAKQCKDCGLVWIHEREETSDDD